MFDYITSNYNFDINIYLCQYNEGLIDDKIDDIIDDESSCRNVMEKKFYQWYMGNEDKRKLYEKNYYSEDELIEHLKTNASLDELKYYHEYGNERIIDIVHEIYKKQINDMQNQVDILDKELLNKSIDELLIIDINYYKFDKLHHSIISKKNLPNDIKQKYNKLLQKIATEINLQTWEINEFYNLKYTEINNKIDSLIISEINTYLELPPYHKKQLEFITPITNILNKFYLILQNDSLKDLSNKVINIFCEIIKELDLTDYFYYNRIQNIDDINIKSAIEYNFNQLIKQIPTTDYTTNNYKFSVLCESKHESIRKTALDKLKNEKDKYMDLYNKYYLIKNNVESLIDVTIS